MPCAPSSASPRRGRQPRQRFVIMLPVDVEVTVEREERGAAGYCPRITNDELPLLLPREEGRGEEGPSARIIALRKHQHPLSPTSPPLGAGEREFAGGSARMCPRPERSLALPPRSARGVHAASPLEFDRRWQIPLRQVHLRCSGVNAARTPCSAAMARRRSANPIPAPARWSLHCAARAGWP